MCVCVYIYIYIYCVYIYMCVCIYMCIYIYICVCVCVYIRVCTYICVCVYMCVCVCMCAYIYIFAYVRARACVCVCVCVGGAFVIQHAKRMRRTLSTVELSGSTICIHIICKHKTLLIPSIIQRDTINAILLHAQCLLFFSDFNHTSSVSKDFSKKKILKYQITRELAQWKPNCSMRTEKRADMTKL